MFLWDRVDFTLLKDLDLDPLTGLRVDLRNLFTVLTLSSQDTS